MADTKTSVVITYSKPGTAPPIYLAGSFPESGWQPREMEYKNVSNDHYVFSKAVEVEEGKEYQYKFRIGDGDWWMSDEDAPIVVDDIGNRNNLLSVPIKPSSHNNSSSNEENSTPRTIPDTDIKASTMDTIIEPTHHTESEDKVSDDPNVEAVSSVKDSPSGHGIKNESEKPEETHETSLPVTEAGHTVESGKETPELDLSSVPAEELEVSTTGCDEPENLESHLQPVTEEIKTATTDLPDSSTVPVDELEVLDTEIEEPLNSESHAQPETAKDSETTTTETPDLHPTSTAQESNETSNDSSFSEANVPESKEITSQDVEVLHAETGAKKTEVIEQQEPTHSAIEEPKSSETETKEEATLTHVKEPASIQEPMISKDVDDIKEEPEVAYIKESTLEPEQHASKSEPKEEIDSVVGDAKPEEKLTEETETSESHSEPLVLSSVIADETTEKVAEEPKEEKLESSEIDTSNAVPSKESVESVSEDSGSAEQPTAQETDTTPKEEQPESEPILNEKPIDTENTTSNKENEVPEDVDYKATEVDENSAVKTSVDETIEAHKPVDEIDSNSKKIPDQEVVQKDEADEPVASTESGTEDDGHSSIPIEAASAPIVSVEKVDSEPRHGDDFGSNATFAQKDAHTLHAQDALPDHITIREQASTPDLANVAAEVADSAEVLDETPPTPPMSDTEAGKTGYRRLSYTPIPEVAATAAEVADTAAHIDDDPKPNSIELPTPQRDFVSHGVANLERDLDMETPSEERAPLFAHERNGPPTAEERLQYESAQTRLPASEPMFREFDPNDPGLEPFPNNFNQILEHVRRLENHLSEDPTDVERTPLSPVTTNGNHHATAGLTTPSPQSLALESSPSLLPIVEENAEGESESKLTALPPSMEKSQADGNGPDGANQESDEQQIETNDTETVKTDAVELSESAAIETSKPQLPATDFTEGSSKLRPVLPDLPQTPFVENKSLNLAEGSATSSSAPVQDSPSITVQPATPAASVNANIDKSAPEEDAAKTTSFADGTNDSQLRARKQPSSSAPDRSITPSSMRSAGDDAKSRNFLRAFFQVVFVDWIGGLIRKLCGGGRHTLIAVPVLLIVVTAPILYLSGLANFGFGLSS
ncbi:uncharacterized protein EAE97_011405 [Botrytis byssoidea]|uniref:AMP-activated protein kinase glycogen-binding domain-containing protein n=1 Tax=Botrytis byssoidea TaxID=139641 RepID=A0A9P5LKS8_9HELO|nr:uncharacterized protein EAE97_011405 [Botrytis byssoidea]KAF7921137.1 hypothetical protein EAE97_011405 [Botrytis byssoidea]